MNTKKKNPEVFIFGVPAIVAMMLHLVFAYLERVAAEKLISAAQQRFNPQQG